MSLRRRSFSLFMTLLSCICFTTAWAQDIGQARTNRVLLLDADSERLKKAISIEGILLMLDDTTPHVAVVVQAVTDEKVIATTLSDEQGKYQFTNLKPGRYQVRCYTLDGYVYYMEGKDKTQDILQATYLNTQRGKALRNIDFRFAPFKKGTWRTYTQFSGLVHNRVREIHRTPDGIFWFGTANGGISRYDGKRFVNFTPEDGLAHNQIWEMHQDLDGVMWFGTEAGGVSRYDGKEFINFTTEDGLAGNWVAAIHCDPDGVMWFGTEGGLSRYDGKEFINFTTEDGLADNFVTSIHRDPDGVMWLGTRLGGISRYDGEEFVNLNTEDGLASNQILAIHGCRDGVIWFGTWNGGASCYDGKGFVNFSRKDGLGGNTVWDIYDDPDGAVWSATGGGGVSRYDGEGFVNFTTEDGLANNIVWASYQDPNDMMWFGTNDGISCYDEECANFTTKDGLAGNDVIAIHCDPDGVMWFGTNGGVSRYDARATGNSPNFTNFTTEDGLAHNVVCAIHRDPDGILWFGTRGGGISRYDGKKFTNFTTRDGLPHNSINPNAIYRDPDGVMWIGTDGGVSRYDARAMGDSPRFVDFTTNDGLAYIFTGGIWENDVTAVHRDLDGTLWFGIEHGGGVYIYDGKEFDQFSLGKAGGSNSVKTIYRDRGGTTWVGAYVGLFYYDGVGDATFATEDKLAYGCITAIYQDQDGKLWVATRYGGAYCYNGSEWASLDVRDGLASNDVRSICQDADGVMWFGTAEGVTRYRPGTTPPEVHIISVTTDQTYRDLSAVPAFAPGTRVTVEYDSIDFRTAPEKRQYRYQVKNIDADWRKATTVNTCDYIFTKPGTQTFMVQAIDRDLNYSEPASVELTVVQPFYLRAVFLIPTISSGIILLATVVILATALTKRRRQVHAYQLAAVQELQDAHEMQMSLLPEAAPPIEGMDIAGRSIPANTVGGDFFDYLSLPDGRVGIAIADVSGKGLRAAMNATMANGMMHEVATIEASCGRILSRLNAHLYPLMEKQMFTAFSLAILDQDAGVIQWSNAGQPLPMIKRSNGVSEADGEGELPLGMAPDVTYPDHELKLQTGDIVIFYTDGIIEAENETEEMYGTERLETALSGIGSGLSSNEIIDAILKDVTGFTGSAEQYDDMTIVVIRKL